MFFDLIATLFSFLLVTGTVLLLFRGKKPRDPAKEILSKSPGVSAYQKQFKSYKTRQASRVTFEAPDYIRLLFFSLIALAGSFFTISFLAQIPDTAPLAYLFGISMAGMGLICSLRLCVKQATHRRNERIHTSMIQVLDLWSLCLGAGMSFQSALIKIAQDPDAARPELQKELQITREEILAGCPRELAMKHLARRCGDTPEMRTLIFHITQAEKLGSSMAQTLRSYADSLRFKRREDVKEMIQTLPVKLILPIIFFILPAILVVTVAPSLIRLFVLLNSA